MLFNFFETLRGYIINIGTETLNLINELNGRLDLILSLKLYISEGNDLKYSLANISYLQKEQGLNLKRAKEKN